MNFKKLIEEVKNFKLNNFTIFYDCGDELTFNRFNDVYVLDGEDSNGNPIYGGSFRDPEWVSDLLENDKYDIDHVEFVSGDGSEYFYICPDHSIVEIGNPICYIGKGMIKGNKHYVTFDCPDAERPSWKRVTKYMYDKFVTVGSNLAEEEGSTEAAEYWGWEYSCRNLNSIRNEFNDIRRMILENC